MFEKKVNKTLDYLASKKHILLLTTSNRWVGDEEKPKSTLLAERIAEAIGKEKVTLIDVPLLRIYHCEGNISRVKGNNCGVKQATLSDKKKNPTGNHRCWASINNKDDELWKISKTLFESDCIIFFGSVRWGQMNAYYQKLIERLSWIENRHSTLSEDNIIKKTDAGIIIIGQNWNSKSILKTQITVLQFYGFNVVNTLCWNWQYTNNKDDENKKSYINSNNKFNREIILKIKKRE